MSGSLYDIIAQAESGGNPYAVNPLGTSSGNAQGLYQITTGTWQDFAPGAGVDLSQYPTALSAPASVQQQVASTIPLSRWASSTVAAVENAFGGNVPTNETLGQIAAELGQSGGATASGVGSGPAGTQTGGTSGTQTGSCGLNPVCWVMGLASAVGGYAVRGVLLIVGLVLLLGAIYLFATRTQAVAQS